MSLLLPCKFVGKFSIPAKLLVLRVMVKKVQDSNERAYVAYQLEINPYSSFSELKHSSSVSAM